MIQKKVCIVGAFGVGKTSLVARFVDSIFTEDYQTTVGVKISKKLVVANDEEIMLVLWDLAGEDKVSQVRPSHLNGSAAYILVADGCRGSTLNIALDLQRRAQKLLGSIPFVLAVNKSDLRENWEIQQPVLDGLPTAWDTLFTSAKNGDAVEELFQRIAIAILAEDHVTSNSSAGAC